MVDFPHLKIHIPIDEIGHEDDLAVLKDAISDVAFQYAGTGNPLSEDSNPNLVDFNKELTEIYLESVSVQISTATMSKQGGHFDIIFLPKFSPKSDEAKARYSDALDRDLKEYGGEYFAKALAEFGADEELTRIKIQAIIDSDLTPEQKCEELYEKYKITVEPDIEDYLSSPHDIKKIKDLLKTIERDTLTGLSEIPELEKSNVKLTSDLGFTPLSEKLKERLWTQTVSSKNLGNYSINLN